VKEQMKEAILANRAYAHAHGMDAPTITDWQWAATDSSEAI